jgi:RNA polymerase sigma factor (TIGR02999 family)
MSPEPASSPPITALLQNVAAGDRAAIDAIFTALYPDLKRIARSRLRQQGHGDGLHTTTLVHESFMRLVQARALNLQDRRHFFAYAAKMMRNIIVDSAREHQAQRRGGGAEHVTLSGDEVEQVASGDGGDELVRVHDAVRALEAIDPDLAELVEMRYFGGYDDLEIAQLLGITDRTVRRRWEKARAWLYVALQDGGASLGE